MTYWTVLGIDPTTDESVIKKAYASQLQVHHPEEDPEGYQRLREAYEWAKKQANALQVEEDYCDLDDPYDEIAVTQHSTWQADDPGSSQLKLHPAQVFFEQMEELYDDFLRRVDPEQWKWLMTNDYMWDMEYQGERLYRLLEFLEDHRHLPWAVWEVLNQSFQLLEQKEDLFDLYDEDEIAFIIGQIQGTSELGYECFEGKQLDFDIEHYLTLRQDAQTLLMEGNPVAARDDLAEAHAMFQDDPDLQLMRAKCYITIGQKPEALSCLQRVLDLKPDEHEARLLMAQILYEQQQFDEAIRECEFLREQGRLDQDVLSVHGNSAIELGGIEQVWEQTKQNEPIWQEFYHFRYNLLLRRMWNKHLFSQEHNPYYDDYRRQRKKDIFFVSCILFLRLSWLYLFLFGLVYFIFHLPPVFLGLLLIVLCGSAWKTIRTIRMILS
ncbi:tetratricopeptide repeat protein [Paenibacillus woosongensis]|uniref:Tetratricopeptide repeat protein n=1 Tax=Paenibacillus woosongensis TaxID=307580 RepID=A0A7X2YYR7_9BACL|nr:tetratricopeptide repeat protein [Paenibacillus woosongensis]MUG44300.1 tetratricopeptide repeat protein [Paenibacillus woosongensis]